MPKPDKDETEKVDTSSFRKLVADGGMNVIPDPDTDRDFTYSVKIKPNISPIRSESAPAVPQTIRKAKRRHRRRRRYKTSPSPPPTRLSPDHDISNDKKVNPYGAYNDNDSVESIDSLSDNELVNHQDSEVKVQDKVQEKEEVKDEKVEKMKEKEEVKDEKVEKKEDEVEDIEDSIDINSGEDEDVEDIVDATNDREVILSSDDDVDGAMDRRENRQEESKEDDRRQIEKGIRNKEHRRRE